MRKKFRKKIKEFITIGSAFALFASAVNITPLTVNAEDFSAGKTVSESSSEGLMKNESSVIVGFEELSDDAKNVTIYERMPEEELLQSFPRSLRAYLSNGEVTEISVTWETAEDYEAGDVYYYVYDPVINGYDLSYGVEAPYIVVWVEEEADVITFSQMLYTPAPRDDGNGQGNTENGQSSGTNESAGGSTDNNGASGSGDNASNGSTSGSEGDGNNSESGENGGNNGESGSTDNNGTNNGEGGSSDNSGANEGGSSENNGGNGSGENGSNGNVSGSEDTGNNSGSGENGGNNGEGGSSDNNGANGSGDNGGNEGANGSSENNGGNGSGDNGNNGENGSGNTDNGNNENGENKEEQKKESVLDPNKSNEENIFDFFVKQVGLNEAGAVGVVANIKAESSFNPKAYGDKINGVYTSFGICQWHNSRWENLKTFCTVYDEDWESLEGQLKFLQYELEHNYKHVLKALKAVSNTPDGAYDAGYVFCAKFEIPANTAVKADGRGRVARDTYWPKYGATITGDGQEYIWKTAGGKSYWYENGVKQGTVDDAKGVIGDGTVRGREIYDPKSDAWYWLDAVYDGAKAVSKEVWIPYIFNGEENWDDEEAVRVAVECGTMGAQVLAAIRAHGTESAGKWVRYDAEGRMVKGWYTVEGADAEIYPEQVGNKYYYDPKTGLMAKGCVRIDDVEHYFDEVTGVFVW